MWIYDRAVKVERPQGKWNVRIVVRRGDEEQGGWITFDHEPKPAEIADGGRRYAEELNLSESYAIGSVVTRFAFRSRFTLDERVAIDNVAASALSDAQKAVVLTILKDMDAAQEIDLRHPSTMEGVHFLEAVGLLPAGRAAAILGT